MTCPPQFGRQHAGTGQYFSLPSALSERVIQNLPFQSAKQRERG